MRRIDRTRIENSLNEEWRQFAKSSFKALLKIDDLTERKRAINAAVWHSYYAKLPDDLATKCWYCEIDIIGADVNVDHFRPKGRVVEVKKHEGYWWLAYDWENYRVACQHCNQRRVAEDTDGGKGCHFPIFDEKKRAFCSEDDCCDEKPAILDPFNPRDWNYLRFDCDGYPTHPPNANGQVKEKVENSIKIYHLNRKKLVRLRNKIQNKVDKLVKRFKRYKNKNMEFEMDEVLDELSTLIQPESRLSNTALIHLKSYRYIKEIRDVIGM